MTEHGESSEHVPEREHHAPPNPEVAAAGRMIGDASKVGMVGSGVVGSVGLLCLIAGSVLFALFNNMDGVSMLTTWPLMIVAMLLVVMGGMALLYAVFGFGLSALARWLGKAVSRGTPGSDTLAMVVAGLAAVTGAAGSVAALVDGEVPVVGIVVAVVAGRIALRLYNARKSAPVTAPVDPSQSSPEESR